jgi:hypothetical protein
LRRQDQSVHEPAANRDADIDINELAAPLGQVSANPSTYDE